MLGLLAAIAGGTPALAERDLGVHRIDGRVNVIWTVREADQDGQWIAAYSMLGQLERAEDHADTLLAGWNFRCDGIMSGVGEWIEADTGTCLFEGEAASRFAAEFAAAPGPWAATVLRIGFYDGSGAYRTLHGEGTIERLMRLPFAAPVGWGFVIGAVAWNRD
ncbi:hypothetical protein [Elioraea sp.]|uniref:hypothetical protein n=1 Tax=Elioraea sp. TaxID=2185103 RepID=UPI003F6F93A9